MPKYIKNQAQLYASHIYFEIYRSNIWVVWCKDVSRIYEFLRRNSNNQVEYPSQNMRAGMFILQIDGQIVPTIVLPWEWKNNHEQIGDVAHESLHAVVAMFRKHGITLPQSTDLYSQDEETLAYYTGHVTEKVISFLQNQKDHKIKFSEEKQYEQHSKTSNRTGVRRNKANASSKK